jgi:hypothetical protein
MDVAVVKGGSVTQRVHEDQGNDIRNAPFIARELRRSAQEHIGSYRTFFDHDSRSRIDASHAGTQMRIANTNDVEDANASGEQEQPNPARSKRAKQKRSEG